MRHDIQLIIRSFLDYEIEGLINIDSLLWRTFEELTIQFRSKFFTLFLRHLSLRTQITFRPNQYFRNIPITLFFSFIYPFSNMLEWFFWSNTIHQNDSFGILEIEIWYKIILFLVKSIPNKYFIRFVIELFISKINLVYKRRWWRAKFWVKIWSNRISLARIIVSYNIYLKLFVKLLLFIFLHLLSSSLFYTQIIIITQISAVLIRLISSVWSISCSFN